MNKTLSEKKITLPYQNGYFYHELDVKEFIKLIKENINKAFEETDLSGFHAWLINKIDRLAGEDVK